ncbi:hypothetical protein L9F63_014995 [Diploptera punctata]|uniref:DNA/pantothenate metabolism flavoprotein C-terminal domain-containing protein n=1 Tax=Diploptera punctata TaxID=6984 RepID=A0AAD8A6P2_DIPPU|nr:hypothetical protein L9F63_014995 [Diploptera punctata]
MSSRWEEFYATHSTPDNFEENKRQIDDFCQHVNSEQKIVLITSGGTTVPLEHNTVRFVDNFSAGTRGSASAEWFLENGYIVIFIYRLKSLEPFVRHFMGQKFLDMLEIRKQSNVTSVQVKNENLNTVLPILEKYKAVKEANQLLSRSQHYFYIPSNEMPTHKMQSAEGPPTISLRLVPKMLEPLVNIWVPNAYVVSFKLETDESILVSKARGALSKYKHKMVALKMTRKTKVMLVFPNTSSEISLSCEEIENGIEIESKIVSQVIENHNLFIS